MKRIVAMILGVVILMGTLPAFAEKYVCDEDTILHLSFDEPLDESCITRDLTILDDGIYGKCCQFNGSNSYIQI
ncbi:MAG: hypothetical protein IKU60_05280, partial [Clostridia bacterium]|nr:hypothetical protein [Clostridia bacterium]